MLQGTVIAQPNSNIQPLHSMVKRQCSSRCDGDIICFINRFKYNHLTVLFLIFYNSGVRLILQVEDSNLVKLEHIGELPFLEWKCKIEMPTVSLVVLGVKHLLFIATNGEYLAFSTSCLQTKRKLYEAIHLFFIALLQVCLILFMREYLFFMKQYIFSLSWLRFQLYCMTIMLLWKMMHIKIITRK